jgi:hypothetical protein
MALTTRAPGTATSAALASTEKVNAPKTSKQTLAAVGTILFTGLSPIAVADTRPKFYEHCKKVQSCLLIFSPFCNSEPEH